MIYIFTFLLSTLLIYFFQRKQLGLLWYFVAIFPIVFLAAYRTNDIGADTHYTYEWFQFCLAESSWKNLLEYAGKSELFVMLQFYISRYTHDFNLCLMVIHYIIYGSVIFALYRLRKHGSIALGLIIYLLLFYRESYNTTRQAMAVCLCMVSYTYLIEYKYIRPIILTLVAMGFHHSAYIFFLVIWVKVFVDKYKRLSSVKLTKLILILVCIVIIVFFETIAVYMESIGVIEEEYVESYANSSRFGTNLPISILALNLANLIIFYVGDYQGKLIESNRTFIQYILIIAFICSFLGLVSTFTVRIGSYFWSITPIYTMILFSQINRQRICLYGYLTFVCLYWFLTVVVANLGDTYPYKSSI